MSSIKPKTIVLYYHQHQSLTAIHFEFHFRTQDICLVLSFTALLFNLYSTYVFQAGLAELLFNKFRFPLIILATYFVLCVSHHVWIVFNYNKTAYIFQWPTALTTLFIIQRLCKYITIMYFFFMVLLKIFFISSVSPIYYYSYKRSALKMSDPRFYENMDWVTDFLAIK